MAMATKIMDKEDYVQIKTIIYVVKTIILVFR